jgi:hypothetical protein
MIPSLPDFHFSAAALKQADSIRQEYLDHSPDDPPTLLGVFWGWPANKAGIQIGAGAPAIGYWRKSEVTAAGWSEVVQVDGVNLVFAVPRADRRRFEGKVLDYTRERAFFLRTP